MTLDHPVFSGNRGGTEWRLEVASLEASLRPLPLLWGQIEIERLALDRPRFRFGEGRDAEAPAAGTPVGAPLVAREQAAPVGEVILTDMSIVHEGAAGRDEVRVPGLRMVAVPESTAVLLTGGILVGERLLRIEGRLEDPAAVFSDRGSDVRLMLRGAKEAEDGGATPPPPPPPDVPAVAEEPEIVSSLRRLAATVGLPVYGPVAIEGRLALTPKSLGITDATMAVSGVVMEGDITVSLDGNEPLFVQMDQIVRKAVAAWSDVSAAIKAGEWREAPLSLGWLASVDVDLDLRVRDGGPRATGIESGRVRLIASDARVRLELAANGDLGRSEAELTVNVDPSAEDAATVIAANGRVEDVVLDKVGRVVLSLLPPPLVSPPPLPEGTLDARLGFASKGATLGEMVSSLNGSFVASVRDGSIAGVDLVLTLEGLAEGREFMSEEDGPLIPFAGRTVFDTVEWRADFVPDAARLTALSISGDRYVIDMSGDVDLRSGEVRAEGQAVLLGDGVEADRSDRLVDLPFGFGGTLAAPVVAAGVPRVDPGGEQEATRAMSGNLE